MIQNNPNPLHNHVFNADFEPLEYENYVNQVRNNCNDEQFEIFIEENQSTLFGVWKRNVFNLVYRQVEIHLDDLPDFTYRTCFEENVTPSQMAQHILENIP